MTRAGRARDLRSTITALATFAVLLVLSLTGAGLVVAHRAILVDALDQSIGDRAEAYAARLSVGRQLAPEDLPSDDVLVQVVDGAGRVVVASPGLRSRSLGAASAGTTVSGARLPDGQAARLLTERAGDLTVHVLGSLEDVEDSTRILVVSLAAGVPAATAVLAALVWWLVGRVLRPVEGIRAEVERISASHLDRRVPEPGTGDEVARLARTMNDMLDRLAAAAERQRRFVADAAHELRSPLARIRAQLEVDAAHPGTADPETSRTAVLTEAVRLQDLVDDLLLLARGDAGPAALARADPVDLDEVVAEQVRGRSGVDTSGVGPVQVRGDRAQLSRAVANLLDNAVRHARERVAVSLAEDGGLAVLTVADDGPGIPQEAQEAVFERFARLDEARSVDRGGAGLGLPIARDIARRHGGDLVLDPGSGSGARFVLRLPGTSGRVWSGNAG